MNEKSSIFRAEVILEISIYSHDVSQISTRKDWSFVLKRFLGAGISFQSLAPTLEKALFWISSLDFLM